MSKAFDFFAFRREVLDGDGDDTRQLIENLISGGPCANAFTQIAVHADTQHAGF